MTVSELFAATAQLGFEASLESEDAFFFAANRGLLHLAAIRPVTKSCIVNHAPLENKLGAHSFERITKYDELVFEAQGARSFYFEADGNGRVIVEAKTGDEWAPIGQVELSVVDRVFRPYRGFIKKDGAFTDAPVRLRFIGDYLYSVRNVALYEYLYSADVSDIPAFEAYTRYDMSALVPDFLSLASTPIKGDVRYDVEGGRVILLPYEQGGVFSVSYLHRPDKIVRNEENDISEDSTAIDLDEELCALLPLLTAAYVWAEDEPEKAEYYLAIYRERAAEIEHRARNAAPVRFNSVNGW